jgi:hypothetical protein
MLNIEFFVLKVGDPMKAFSIGERGCRSEEEKMTKSLEEKIDKRWFRRFRIKRLQGPLHTIEIELWEGFHGLVFLDDMLVDSFKDREALNNTLNNSLDAMLEAIRQGKEPICNEDGEFLGWKEPMSNEDREEEE